jgi:hypothetical protein
VTTSRLRAASSCVPGEADGRARHHAARGARDDARVGCRAGAKKALATVGLGDEEAPEHIRGLRDLFTMYRVVRNGALKQIGQGIALVLIGALVLFVSTKIQLGPPK